MAGSAARPTRVRCAWSSLNDPAMQRYHDTEWGVPVHSDRRHFEFLSLEGAQAGLSWSTILHKRRGYLRAFDGFDPQKISRYSTAKVRRLTENSDIVRNRLKIESVVGNARAFLDVQKEFGTFDAFAWRFVAGKPRQNRWKSSQIVPATSVESDAFSRELRSRGFRFVGSTIVYAHMQAVGMVNDHSVACFRYKEVERLA
ncbi:MAG: DNA-3-methyladenine glycosylase I [Thermoplasmata archaeon]|nr:DNA-3-methyladenine glycosylase I [Thermoplasmata archaeon]